MPTVKVQSFSLEEIKEKHLSVLIPFLPIRFRKHIPADSDEKKTPKALEKRKNQTEKVKLQLTSFYREIILILESEIAEGYLSEAQAKQQEREKEEALKKLAAEKEKVIVRLQKRIKELEQQKN